MSLRLPTINNVTSYSLLESCLDIESLINYAKKNNHESVIISDLKFMYGYMDFYYQCKKNNLKPIFGLRVTHEKSDLLLLAKNKKGYSSLVQISSNDSLKPKWLENLIVIVISGSFTILSDDCYFANQNHEKGIYCRESRFLTKDDYKVFCALKAINNQTKLKNEIEIQEKFKNCFLDQEDLIDLNSIQVKNLFKVIEECEEYELDKQKQIMQFPCPNGLNSNDYLKSLAYYGLFNVRFKENKIPENLQLTYKKRLDYELEVIKTMEFSDYFLIVHDYIYYARSQGILVGPGRGSAAGSLVAYALAITGVDPIKYNLYFERFLNPARKTMPDIDIDFMDTRREEVISYLYEKYSSKNVAQIVTFQKLKAKGAIRDIGRILDINLKKIDYIAKKIPQDFIGNIHDLGKSDKVLQAEINSYPELFDLANKVVNLPRQIGIHAAGIVLSQAPLGVNFPITLNTNDYVVTQFSMDYLEELGLLKMDLLGLRNLTIIQEVISLIYQNFNKEIQIEEIDFKDQSVYQELAKGNTLGIFQLESPGMTRLTKRLKPKCLEDLSLISALFRPGPQKHIDTFLKIRHHEIQSKSLHSSLNDILKPTHNIIVYQEQLIAVVVKVTQCSLSEADLFRRAVSKKDESSLIGLKKNFIEKGLINNYKLNDLEKIWDYIYEFANYGFNHSHSISYAMISYWLAWLKKYYKSEFYCVLLSSFSKTTEYINEASKYQIVCLAPNINYSSKHFMIHNKKIYFGLRNIKGLGEETIQKILLAKQKWGNKPFTDLQKTIGFLYGEGITKSYLTILNRAGYFDSLFEKSQNRYYLDQNMQKIIDFVFDLDKNGNPLFDVIFDEVVWDEIKQDEYNNYQFDLLGYSFIEHKVKKLKNKLQLTTQISMIDEQTDFHEQYLVVIEQVNKTLTKDKRPMAWITVSDESATFKTCYFGNEQNLFDDCLNNKTPCLITIEKNKSNIRIKKVELVNF